MITIFPNSSVPSKFELLIYVTESTTDLRKDAIFQWLLEERGSKFYVVGLLFFNFVQYTTAVPYIPGWWTSFFVITSLSLIFSDFH